MSGVWRRAVREAALIVCLAVVAGAVANARLVGRFFRGEFRSGEFVAAADPAVKFISQAEAEDLFAARSAIFVDSRTREDYLRGHIVGAASLPLKEFEPEMAREKIRVPFAATLVVYCEGGDCHSSIALARLLRKAGFQDVRIFEGGVEAWRAAGLPEAEGDEGR